MRSILKDLIGWRSHDQLLISSFNEQNFRNALFVTAFYSQTSIILTHFVLLCTAVKPASSYLCVIDGAYASRGTVGHATERQA